MAYVVWAWQNQAEIMLEHITLGGLKATNFGFVAWVLDQIKIYDHEMYVIGLKYL
jgi:hypothetical protein